MLERFVDRKRVDTTAMELCYDYPYQWSNTGSKIKHWCFPMPIDERTTRVFFLFYFESLKIPFLPWRIPRALMTLVLRIANRVLIGPLLRQDGFAVEAEQRAWDPSRRAGPRAEPGQWPLSPALTAKWRRSSSGAASSLSEELL
jgi:hypothetical protein